MFNRGDLITLSDKNKYFVADIFEELGRVFIVLSNYEEPEKLKFCYLKENNIKEISNPELIKMVIEKSNINLHKKEVLDEII